MLLMQTALKTYKVQQYAGLTPRERLVMTYDLALEAANDGDAPLLLRALSVLKSALRFDQNPDIALSLQSLYHHCESAVRERESYHEAAQILYTLRESFKMAEARQPVSIQ